MTVSITIRRPSSDSLGVRWAAPVQRHIAWGPDLSQWGSHQQSLKLKGRGEAARGDAVSRKELHFRPKKQTAIKQAGV